MIMEATCNMQHQAMQGNRQNTHTAFFSLHAQAASIALALYLHHPAPGPAVWGPTLCQQYSVGTA